MYRLIRLTGLALSLLIVGTARAQEGIETIPEVKIRVITPRLLTSIAKNVPDAGIKVDAVADNAFGFRGENTLVVMLPDRTLTPGSVAGAGEKTTPVGILLLKSLVPLVSGQIPAADRLARAGQSGDSAQTVVLFLGVRKDAAGPVLEFYSRETKPLLQVPLKKLEAAANAPLCAGKIANLNKEERQADLVLTLGGTSEVTLRLGSPD